MKLSICMMVKNESKYLEQCLQALQPLRDAVSSELIIVDTGSTDNTVEIAKKYTEKIYFHEWNDNFSEMRNITISYAKGEWIFIIDGDEVLEDGQALIDCLKMSVSKEIGAFALTSKNLTNLDDLHQYSLIVTPRLFRHDKHFHYEGAIHNQPVFKGKVAGIPASQVHYGYISNDKELMDRKFQRTSRLLKKELEKNPDSLYHWYQLSVSYAMHGDNLEAIQTIEHGYELFCKQGKPRTSMYIMTHMAQMYQTVRDYKKVEKTCEEALVIRDGYLDLYYFLAEAKTILGKADEGIHYYEKYFYLLDHWEERPERDPAVMDYTQGSEQIARFNLTQLYKNQRRYEEALAIANKITDPHILTDSLENIVFCYLQLEKYQDLFNFYQEKIPRELYEKFYAVMEKSKQDFFLQVSFGVAKAFCDVPGPFGLLQRMTKEIEEGRWTEGTVEQFKEIDFANLPAYCSDILYFLLREKYPLTSLFSSFKEAWFPVLFTAIQKRHQDFSDYLYAYIQTYHPQTTLTEYKMSKMLCRFLLLIDQVSDEQYREVFERYIADGGKYLSLVYRSDILSNAWVYELKNDEEVFLLYLYLAKATMENEYEQCVSYLRQALEVFPALGKGIQFQLRDLKSNIDREKEAEGNQLEDYKNQVKEMIRQLAGSHQIGAAKKMIEEYKSLVPDDLEILLIESNLLLYEMKQDPVVQ